MPKKAAQLDREIDAITSPYVDPVKVRDPNSGLVTDDTGFVALYHFALGMMERDKASGRYAPVIRGKPVQGAACFSVMRLNRYVPRKDAHARGDMKHMRKAWASRKAIAAFVRANDLDRNGAVRLALTHQSGGTYMVANYDSNKDLGLVEL